MLTMILCPLIIPLSKFTIKEMIEYCASRLFWGFAGCEIAFVNTKAPRFKELCFPRNRLVEGAATPCNREMLIEKIHMKRPFPKPAIKGTGKCLFSCNSWLLLLFLQC